MSSKSAKVSPIDEYISGFPERVQAILQKIRGTIKNVVPNATESIVYQIPTFKLKNRNLVHFAAFKHHVGFYPAPSGIVAFKKELLGYSSAKGSVKFPLNEPIPYDLIEKIVAFRVKEVTEGI
nr:DUF1801 domain-containing protein [Candidatus Sigynarchaeota archaeon]